MALAATGGCQSGGCQSDRSGTPESAEAPASPSVAPTADVPAPAAAAEPSAADKALVALKAEARKVVAADRTAVGNKVSYDQAVERHERNMEGVGLNQKLGSEPLTEASLRVALTRHSLTKGLVIEKVRLGAPPRQPAVPAEHRGKGPYRFQPDQIIATAPLEVVVATDDLGDLEAWWRTLPTGVDPLVELVALSIANGRATFHGTAYWRRQVTPPVHVTETPTMAQLAEQARVAIPAGHPRLPEVEALLAEHRSVRAELAPAMAALGKANLLGTLFQFYRQRVGAMESRSFPKPMTGKGGANPAP